MHANPTANFSGIPSVNFRLWIASDAGIVIIKNVDASPLPERLAGAVTGFVTKTETLPAAALPPVLALPEFGGPVVISSCSTIAFHRAPHPRNVAPIGPVSRELLTSGWPGLDRREAPMSVSEVSFGRRRCAAMPTRPSCLTLHHPGLRCCSPGHPRSIRNRNRLVRLAAGFLTGLFLLSPRAFAIDFKVSPPKVDVRAEFRTGADCWSRPPIRRAPPTNDPKT